MAESHTPTNRRKLCFNRTPNVKSEIVWNTLNVNSINARCFMRSNHFSTPRIFVFYCSCIIDEFSILFTFCLGQNKSCHGNQTPLLPTKLFYS